MRFAILLITIGLAAVCVLAQQGAILAGGHQAKGFQVWGRAPITETISVEASAARRALEVERAENEWVRRRETETYEAGLALRVVAAGRIRADVSGGYAREINVGSFQFLFPAASERFGGVERRHSVYGAATGTLRLWRGLSAQARYTWRANAALAERQTLSYGLAWRF